MRRRFITAFDSDDEDEPVLGGATLVPPRAKTCYVSVALLPERLADKHAAPVKTAAAAIVAATTVDESRRTFTAAARIVAAADLRGSCSSSGQRVACYDADASDASSASGATRSSNRRCRRRRARRSNRELLAAAPVCASDAALAIAVESWLRGAVAPEVPLPLDDAVAAPLPQPPCVVGAAVPLLTPDTTVVAPRAIALHSRLVARRPRRGLRITTVPPRQPPATRSAPASPTWPGTVAHLPSADNAAEVDAVADFDELFGAGATEHNAALCVGSATDDAFRDVFRCRSQFEPAHLFRCSGIPVAVPASALVLSQGPANDAVFATAVAGDDSPMAQQCLRQVTECHQMRRLVERYRGCPLSDVRRLTMKALSLAP